MKKLLAIFLMITSFSAIAHGYHGQHYRPGWGWVAPVIIGGVVGYEIARQPAVIMQQAPAYVEQQPLIVQPVCSAWKEVQAPDGRVYRERTCTQ